MVEGSAAGPSSSAHTLAPAAQPLWTAGPAKYGEAPAISAAPAGPPAAAGATTNASQAARRRPPPARDEMPSASAASAAPAPAAARRRPGRRRDRQHGPARVSAGTLTARTAAARVSSSRSPPDGVEVAISYSGSACSP
ncbi:hypothetical protein LUR56_23460 [Streptomyces sp. MT29]|nr:hypothetical protein [Streptomyces sp. MT29]